jgi:hypothetical protein
MLLCVLVVVAPAKRLGQVLRRNGTGILLLKENEKLLKAKKHLTTVASDKSAWGVQGLVLKKDKGVK